MIIKQECSGVYTFFANPNPKSKEERIKWLDDFIEHVQKEREKFENCNRVTNRKHRVDRDFQNGERMKKVV